MSDAATAVPVLECRGLAKTYVSGPLEVPVLAGIDLALAAGERIAIVGASGSGKSTLLHLLGGLDVPTAGEVRIEGRAFASLSESRARPRAQPRARLHLPVPPPAARVHRGRERRDAADGAPRPARGRARGGRRDARARRPRPSAEAPARRAVRRRAPAGRARAGAGHRAALRAGRRAHRQPRPPHGAPGVRPDARAQPRRRHRAGDRHPRPRARGAHRPHADAAGRTAAPRSATAAAT